MVLGIEGDACHLGRTERTLDEELHIAGVVDDINILIAKLVNNAVHTATLNADAGSNRVDAVVIALNCHLGAVARHTGHTANGYQAIGYLRHLGLKKPLKEHGSSAAKNDAGVVVLVVNPQDDSLHCLALAIVVTGNLLALGQVKLVALVIHEQHFTLPHLINLGTHHLTHAVLVLVVQ